MRQDYLYFVALYHHGLLVRYRLFQALLKTGTEKCRHCVRAFVEDSEMQSSHAENVVYVVRSAGCAKREKIGNWNVRKDHKDDLRREIAELGGHCEEKPRRVRCGKFVDLF